jgi:hypothetical protein
VLGEINLRGLFSGFLILVYHVIYKNRRGVIWRREKLGDRVGFSVDTLRLEKSGLCDAPVSGLVFQAFIILSENLRFLFLLRSVLYSVKTGQQNLGESP